MLIYKNTIPSSHLFPTKKAQLQAPPGVNINKLAEVVANQIARTIIHEAAHGQRWAQEYLSGNLRLQNMSRGEEESVAEHAEEKSGLSVDLTPDILDESETTDTMTPEQLLDVAINVANNRNDFFIPRESVENANLSQGQWGEFEMIQGGDVDISSHDTTVAWSNNDRKLLVDVTSIINEYNKALSQSQNYLNQRNMTRQVDGTEPDIPGVSQQPPNWSSGPTVPSMPTVPSR
jgi:hypothetical protein